MALKNRALELKNNLANEQAQAKNLQNKIQQTEQDLGTSLDDLTTELGGKTLSEYVSRERERERERDEFESQLAQSQLETSNYKEQLEKQKDYSKIKQERDQLKTELSQKESQIIIKIINELKLGLNNETNLEQALDKIKELIINKNPDTNQETDLTILRQQLAEKDEEIKKLWEQNKENYFSPENIKQNARQTFKALGIKNSVYQKEIAKITSFQELENFYQQTIKKEISRERREKTEIKDLNIILWVLLFISSLLVTVLLVIKMNRSRLQPKIKRLGRKQKLV